MIIDLFNGAVSNTTALILVVYYGLLAIGVYFFMIKVGIKTFRVLFDREQRDSPEFHQAVVDTVKMIVVIILLATVPVWFPALLTYFGVTNVSISA